MSVIDRIYEAAFVPELWPQVLGDIAALVGSWSGGMMIVDRRLPPLYRVTPNLTEAIEALAQSPFWYDNPRLQRVRRKNHSGFLEVGEFSTEEERLRDYGQHNLAHLGLSWQIGTIVMMPGGEMVVFSFDREQGRDNYSTAEIAWLDGYRPHLARASLMAARLKLDRAQASVDALNAMGIPAATVAVSGAVMSTNTLFEGMGTVLRPAAFGRLVAEDRQANELLQMALPAPDHPTAIDVRSIPLRVEGRPLVVHVIPLHRSATDIFDQAAALVAVTGYAQDCNLPPDAVLRGLFDLSAAEARVAKSLAAGLSLAQVAASCGISMTTARTHLAQVFRKTGMRQQSQLVALLKGSHTFAPQARWSDGDVAV